MKKYKLIRSEDCDWEGYKLKDCLKNLQELISVFGEEATLVFCSSYDYDTSFFVQAERLETDDEYKKRIAYESKIELNARAQRLAQYEKLKAEFEGSKEEDLG